LISAGSFQQKKSISQICGKRAIEPVHEFSGRNLYHIEKARFFCLPNSWQNDVTRLSI